jgi:hypothetical protein
MFVAVVVVWFNRHAMPTSDSGSTDVLLPGDETSAAEDVRAPGVVSPPPAARARER